MERFFTIIRKAPPEQVSEEEKEALYKLFNYYWNFLKNCQHEQKTLIQVDWDDGYAFGESWTYKTYRCNSCYEKFHEES